MSQVEVQTNYFLLAPLTVLFCVPTVKIVELPVIAVFVVVHTLTSNYIGCPQSAYRQV